MDPQFKELHQWISSSLEVTRVENDTLEGTGLTRNQGVAIALAKILKTIEDS